MRSVLALNDKYTIAHSNKNLQMTEKEIHILYELHLKKQNNTHDQENS